MIILIDLLIIILISDDIKCVPETMITAMSKVEILVWLVSTEIIRMFNIPFD